MKCPVCNQDMIVVEHSNVELDYCTRCRGAWFDVGELELLLKSVGMESRNLFSDCAADAAGVRKEKKRKCPICGQRMDKAAIACQPEVIVDACRRGDGLWFDGGEALKVVKRLSGGLAEKHDAREQVIAFLGETLQGDKEG